MQNKKFLNLTYHCMFLSLCFLSCKQIDLSYESSSVQKESIDFNSDLQINLAGANIQSYRSVKSSENLPDHFSIEIKAQSLDFKIDLIHSGCKTYYVKVIINQALDVLESKWQLFTTSPTELYAQASEQTLGAQWNIHDTLQPISQIYSFDPYVDDSQSQLSWWIKVNQSNSISNVTSKFNEAISDQRNSTLCVSIHPSKDIYDRKKNKYLLRQRIQINRNQEDTSFAVIHTALADLNQFESFINDVNESNLEFLVILLNTSLNIPSYKVQQVLTLLNRLKVPYFFTNSYQGLSTIKSGFGNDNFAFDSNSVRFAFLNTRENTLRRSQYERLDQWSSKAPLIWKTNDLIKNRILFSLSSPLAHKSFTLPSVTFTHHTEGIRLLNRLSRHNFDLIFSAAKTFKVLTETNKILHVLVPYDLQRNDLNPSLKWVKVDIDEVCTFQFSECITIEIKTTEAKYQ